MSFTATKELEAEVDELITHYPVKRAASLMVQYAGGTLAHGLVDCYPAPLAPHLVMLEMSEVRRSLGVDFTLDWHVLGWMFGACLFTALAFGVAPAHFVHRLDLNNTLKSGSRGTTGDRGHRRGGLSRYLSARRVYGELLESRARRQWARRFAEEDPPAGHRRIAGA